MKKNFFQYYLLSLLLPFLLSSCASNKALISTKKEATVSDVKFLHEYVLPANTTFQNTLIGGISGIDYDAEKDQYYLISDDPSQFSTARIYTAKIGIKNYKIEGIQVTGVTFMHQQNGQVYPKYGSDKTLKADGESVRYNPKGNNFIWSNEGERLFKNGDSIIIQPALTLISAEGKFIDTIPLPKEFHFTKKESGPRKNLLFEGLAFADLYRTLYASLEEPLYQDGAQAAFGYGGAMTRILKFDLKTRKNTAQYAYNLDAIPAKPSEENSWNGSGISEIMTVNDHTLLVMERGWVKGHDDHSFVRLYLVDLTDAKNEIDNPSFMQVAPKPLPKKLLINFDSLNRHIDNFEGLTFGPNLPNGHKTLVFAVDDNFSKTQVQQFFLFEVIP